MEILQQRVVKARKEHVCDYCGRAIIIGEKYEYSFIENAGETWSWRSCSECLELVDTLKIQTDGDGLTTDDFEDIVSSQCRYRKLFLDEDGDVDTENHTTHEMVVALLEVLK